MKIKIIYIASSITFCTLSLLVLLFLIRGPKQIVPTVKTVPVTEILKTVSATKASFIKNHLLRPEALTIVSSPIETVKKMVSSASFIGNELLTANTAKKVAVMTKFLNASGPDTNSSKKTPVLRTVRASNSTLKQISFEQLPGWNDTGVKKSLHAFQKSCETFLKQKPDHSVGSEHIKLKAKDWQPACKEALLIDADYEIPARFFFEKWFYPIELAKDRPVRGLFTGYYMPSLNGNLTRTRKYTTPIYGLPRDLKWNSSHSRYTRAAIDKGIIKDKAPIIAWINSPSDRLFLEIEGSGVIKLDNGKNLYLGYAGENGAHYTSIGSLLIKKGIMTRDNASKNAIQRYLKEEPQKANSLLHSNKSFVFFEDLKTPMALGAQGMALTPGYSLAIDKKWIPLGTPLWLTTKIPSQLKVSDKKFQRLMIAQDTGGAINGLMRGDIYWGSGKKAAFLGENMKNEGRFWLLLPKRAFENLASLNRWKRIK